MEKVVIIVANSRWFNGREYMEPIMALPILASQLAGKFEYTIIDCNAKDLNEMETKREIQSTQARFVLITALSVELHKHYHLVAKLSKEALPEAEVIMGGVYATTCYDHIIEDRNIDYVLLGYAENRLDKFLQKLCEKSGMDNFAGAVYRENGSVKINPVDSYIGDVREMAKPDYSKIDLSPYVEHGFRFSTFAERELPIITSYGCPHNCLFCATRTISGRKIAYREVEDVIDEMRYLKNKYNINAVVFLDDNILTDEKRAKKLFERMIEEKFNFKFRLMSTAAWHLKDEIIDIMVKAGCYALSLSIESGVDRVLHEIIRKPLKKEIVPGVIEKLQKRGIFVSASIVIGFPGETWNEIRETIAFAEKCNPDYLQIFMATILPQTDLFKVAKENHCIPEDFSFFNEDIYTGFVKGNITTDEFIPDELEILRSYEWDRINFSTQDKREKFCKHRGITEKELAIFRQNTRRSAGKAAGLRKGSV